MKVLKNCENIYINCITNCHPHCLDTRKHWIAFGTANLIALYNLNLSRIVSMLSHHSMFVNSVRWIDDEGNFLISSSLDRTSIIWERNNDSFNVKHILRGHNNSVIISDSRLIDNDFYTVSSSNDKTLCIWINDQIIFSENLKHFIFDVKIYDKLIIPGLIVLVAGSNKSVMVNRFDIDSKKLEHLITLSGNPNWVKAVDLVTLNGRIMVAAASEKILIYKIKSTSPKESGRVMKTFTVTNLGEKKMFCACLQTILNGHANWVTDLKWIYLENQYYLLSSSMDKTIILWEGIDMETDPTWIEKFCLGEIGVNCIGFLACSYIPYSERIIGQSYRGAIHIWQKSNIKDNWISCTPITGHFKEVTDLVWEPEGEYFLTCSSDQTTRLHSQWYHDDIHSWHEIARPQIHGYDIKSVAMASRLKFISGGDEKVIRVFTATRHFIESFRKISLIELDTNQSVENIAEYAIVPPLGLSNSSVFDIDEKNMKIIKLPPSEEMLLHNTLWSESKKLYAHIFEIFAIAVNHSHTILASSSKASNYSMAGIILWDLKTYRRLCELRSHNLTVTQIRFSPNDLYLLSVSRDRTWALFLMKDSKYRRVAFLDKNSGKHKRVIWDCAWTPDSKYFLTGSRDKSVIIWSTSDLNILEEDCNLPAEYIKNFDHAVTSIDVHTKIMDDDSYLVCVGLENGSFFLYSLSSNIHNDWLKIYDFENFWHSLAINRIRFSPKIEQHDSDVIIYLASCSNDASTKLFRITF